MSATSAGAISHDLSAIMIPVGDGAASIESAFLQAGDGLGRGLQVFEALNAQLASLGGELGDASLQDATRATARVAEDLARIAERLPDDSATLATLHASGSAVSEQLNRLIESMRMMTVLTRAARIEAVVFQDRGTELVRFTQEVVELTRSVGDKVQSCSRDHVQLLDALAAASRAQSALERDFRDKLAALAAELAEAHAHIVERRRRSVDVARDLATRSDVIAQAVRVAIMSLQTGDSTRQRLEHVHEGLSHTVPPAERPAGGEADAMRAAMWRLQAVQLGDAAASFDGEVGAIDGSLRRLIEDARDFVAKGQAVYGEGGDGGTSFLHAFQERLARAASFIHHCETARATLNRVIGGMRGRLGELHSTISDLNQVIPGIVLIGLNAGLKAGRLGPEGRGLVVIAQELKGTADLICDDARLLLPAVGELETLAGRLGDTDTAGRDIDADVAGIMSALEGGGQRLASLLGTLRHSGSQFEDEIARARARFADMASLRAALAEATLRLGEIGQAPPSDEAGRQAGLRQVDALMKPRYTMAREREIHAEIIGADLTGQEVGAEPEPAKDAEEIDDLLF